MNAEAAISSPARWWLSAAAIAAGAAAPLLAVLLSGHTLAWSDTAQLFGPMRSLVVEALRELRLPLWNPHEAMGIPLLAQMMHGVLHPVSIVAAFVAPGTGTDFLVVAYVVLAALGAGTLARVLGASPEATVVAGLAYGLSGYTLGMSSVLQYLAGAATAPWVVAALRSAGTRTARAVALAALAVACSVFAGDPQWTIVATVLGAVLAGEAGGARGLARAVAAAALGMIVGAVQLVPSLAFLGQTTRSEGLSITDRMEWSISPFRIVELIAPGFFAFDPETLISPVFQWLGYPGTPVTFRPFVPSVFIGGAVLLPAALGARASRSGRWLLWAALGALWLALGTHAGAQQLLEHVPVWGAFRYSEKLLGPFTLCIAVLAALGVDRLAAEPRGSTGRAMLVAAGACGCVAVALLGLPFLDGLPVGAPPDAPALARRALAIGLLHAGGSIAGVGALLVARTRSAWFADRFGWLAAGVVFSASSVAAVSALHVGVPGVRDEAPLAAHRVEGGVTRVIALKSPPYANPMGLRPGDLDVAGPSRMAAAPFNVASRIDQMDQYSGFVPRRWDRFGARAGPEVGSGILPRFGLTHIVVRSPWTPEEAQQAGAVVSGGRAVEVNREWGYSVWAMPHRAWARFAPAVVAAASEDEALEAVLATQRAGADVAVVEGGPPAGTASGRVLSVERRAEWLRIDAEASGDAFLVVNDSHFPGWRAMIDGMAVPIVRTDYLVRGVSFPAGRHVLEMRYEPWEAKVGVWLTVAGLLAVGALGTLHSVIGTFSRAKSI